MTSSNTMKKQTPSLETLQLDLIKELYRSYRFFNNKFAKGQLPEPIIMIQADTKNTYGWFRQNSWKIQKKDVPEITLTTSCLNAGVDEIMNTLLHEMAHLYNFTQQINDCDSKQVHNEAFAKAARMFGLKAEKVKRFGFAHTVHTPESKAAVDKLKPRKEVYQLYYNAFNATKEDKPKKEKAPKLAPVIIGTEVKELIKGTSEQLGCDQKELTEKAVLFYLDMLKNKPKSIPAKYKIVKK